MFAGGNHKLQPIVFEAFGKSLQKALGEFKSFDKTFFTAEAEYNMQSRRIRYRGVARYTNADILVTARTHFGMLEAFNFTFPDSLHIDDWKADIGDTNWLKDKANSFATEVLTGDTQKAFAMLPDDFQEQFPLPKLVDIQKQLQEKFGSESTIRFSRSEYIADEERWKFHFEFTGNGSSSNCQINLSLADYNDSLTGFNFEL